MGTKKLEKITEWTKVISTTMMAIGCCGLMLKCIRDTMFAVYYAKTIDKWYYEEVKAPEQEVTGSEPESAFNK